MKHLSIVMGAALALLVLAPGTARAQDDDRAFIRPMVGATVGSGPGAVFGGTVGVKAAPKLQIIGEFGRMTNIMPTSVADQVEISAAQVANTMGGKHSASASASANYGMAGFRYGLRDVSGAHTYVEFGVGVANVKSDVSAVIRGSEQLQGDISSRVATPFTSATPETKPLMAAGGGIVLGVTRTTAVEMGCRYLRIFTSEKAVNSAKIYGGFRFGF